MKTRQTKELLTIVYDELKKDYVNQKLCPDICNKCIDLCGAGIITEQEYTKVLAYIRDNRPKIDSVYYHEEMVNSDNFWKRWDLPVRIFWLEELIERMDK